MNVAQAVSVSMMRRLVRSSLARQVREHAGLTRAEVAEVVGVGEHAVARWEAGSRIPRGEPAVRYAELLEALTRGGSE